MAGDSGQSPQEAALQALESLIRDDDLETLEELLAEFNLFDVLGIATRELSHSAFLAWLLNPLGSHGLRDYFLRRFLSDAAGEALERGMTEFGVRPVDVHRWTLNDVVVTTEQQIGIGGRRIDIFVEGKADSFVCLVENKIGSGESQDQLRDYLSGVEGAYEDATPFPIFLTPDGREPENEEDGKRYVPVGYQSIHDIIERVLETRGSTISTSVAGFLSQYARTLRRHVLDTKDNIDELAVQLYEKHRGALDLIIKARPTEETVGWEVVDRAIEQYSPELKPDFSSRAFRRFYSSSLEDIPELKQGEGWTKSGRIVLLEFKYNPNMRLDLMIGPARSTSEEIRQRVYSCLLQSGVGVRPAGKLAAKWHMVYSTRTLSSQDFKPFDPEVAKPKMEQAIKEFFASDYFPLVNAIRTEFGLNPVPQP